MVVQHAFTGASSSAFKAVSVFVVSPSTQSERTFSTSITIADLKTKLELVTGVPSSSQRLLLRALEAGASATYELAVASSTVVAVLDDDTRTLYDYGVDRDGLVIQVSTADSTLHSSLYSHVEDSNVEKFELTDEEYARRTDTVMAYKARHKIGRFAQECNDDDATSSICDPDIKVGDRVSVDMTSNNVYTRKGTVRFFGVADFAKGTWVGIEYDEPVGKNDGSVDGTRYFQCKPKYGGFVRRDKCKVIEGAAKEGGDGTDDELAMSD